MAGSGFAALAAVILAAAALVFSALSIPSVVQPPAPPSPVTPATMELSLIITGLGALGEPAKHHFYNPQMVVARRGDTVRLRVMNQSFASHAVQIDGYDVRTRILPGGAEDTISVVAEKGGIFPYRCYIPHDPASGACSPDHATMVGYLVVLDQPR